VSAAEWAEAFVKAQGEFDPIVKDTSVTIPTTGASYSYKYAALPDIIESVQKVLHDNGLTLVQSVGGDIDRIAVETRIYHSSGHVEFFGPLVLKVAGDAKAAGSAITYARRYALCAALGIAPDEDDDGARASRSESVEEKQAISAWHWLWNESKIYKAWSDEERMAAIKAAMSYLAIEEVNDRELANRIFTHLKGVYDSRPMQEQGALPVE
jgi:hypothetical protein